MLIQIFNTYSISMQFKVPYMPSQQQSYENTYFQMIKHHICPNFAILSLPTLMIVLSSIIFIWSRMMFTATEYTKFLQSPKQLDFLLLDIYQIKQNKFYLYQTITSLFLHNSYTHFTSNMFFSIFMMYQMQHCWSFGVGWCLVAGVCTHGVAVLVVGEGRMQGLSGVLCACIGVYASVLSFNQVELRQTFASTYYGACVFTFILTVTFFNTGFSAFIHLIAYIFGFIFGCAFYPQSLNSPFSQRLKNILKLISLLLIVVQLVLLFIM